MTSLARGEVAVDVARLEREVRLISTTFSPRDHLHPENLDRIAAYVRDEFAAAGGRVSEQPFSVNGRTYRNVIASFGPDPGERVVVGAHYDAFGPAPGADDNASGVAGLLELGRLLGRTNLATRVDLVAYTLEEPPYFATSSMGSAHHAKALAKDGVTLRGMISLEMIGFFSDAEDSQAYPSRLIGLFYPSKGNFIGVVGNFRSVFLLRKIKTAMSQATTLPVQSLAAPGFVLGVDWSDHLNYWNAGYAAVMVTDTAFFRNRNYHTMADTADTLDYKRMGEVVRGVYGAVVELAK
jgi:Zn-dependent M28 family amino/carboxypeptidase